MALEILTGLLVLITGFYAWRTHQMTNATKEMADVAQRSLRDSQESRRQGKSDDAARRCLHALWEFDGVIRERPPAGATAQDCRRVYEVLDTEGALLADRDVRGRVRICGQVAFTAGWSDEQLDLKGVDRGMAVVVMKRLTRTTTSTLVAYLREEKLPPWTGLPAAGEEQAWLLSTARGSEDG